jgi:adenosylhomocysteine nucleosidase
MFAVPFVVIRSISDKADGNAKVNFAEFTIAAAAQAVRILLHIVHSYTEVETQNHA